MNDIKWVDLQRGSWHNSMNGTILQPNIIIKLDDGKIYVPFYVSYDLMTN